jgi:hypothetical protein
MLKAEYQTRGPIPQDVIEAVPFKTPELEEGQVLRVARDAGSADKSV